MTNGCRERDVMPISSERFFFEDIRYHTAHVMGVSSYAFNADPP